MNKLFVAHIEKVLFAIVAIICLIVVAGNIKDFFGLQSSGEEADAKRQMIEKYINAATPPAIDPIPDYVNELEKKITGPLVKKSVSINRELVYNRGFRELIPINKKPRIVLLPPKPEITIQGGYNMVQIVFKNDPSVASIVTNTFTPGYEGAPNYMNQKGVIFGGILQRRLVNDGKQDVADAPWQTLTGSKDKPDWKTLENPLATSYFLTGNRNFVSTIDTGYGEPGMGMGMGGEGMMDDPYHGGGMQPMPGGGMPVMRRPNQLQAIAMEFAYEDMQVDAFKTYVYRMAIVAAVQEGIRLFRAPATEEELRLEKKAEIDFDQKMYPQGEMFIGNPQITKEDLINVYGMTELSSSTGMGFGNKTAKAGEKPENKPFYLVASTWTGEMKAEVQTDSEIFLSGRLGQSVSLYIMKHYRYTYEQAADTRGGMMGGGGYGGRPVEQPMVKMIAWTDLLQSFTHGIGDQIGKEPRPRSVPARNFLDNKPRVVDFTTPWVLMDIGRADQKQVRVVDEWVNDPQTGQLVLKPVERVFVNKDVLFIVIKNVVTDESSKLWLVGNDVISRVRRAAAEAMLKERARIEEEMKRDPRDRRPQNDGRDQGGRDGRDGRMEGPPPDMGNERDFTPVY